MMADPNRPYFPNFTQGESSSLGYVTQAQLDETTQRILLTLQQQFASFANEPLSRFQALSPSPVTPVLEEQLRRHEEDDRVREMTTQPPPQNQTRFAVNPQQIPCYQDALCESCSRDPIRTPRHPSQGVRYTYVTQTPINGAEPSAANRTSGCDMTFNLVADAIGGNTPLSNEIMSVPCPKFKMPSIEKYKGESDPAEYAQNFFDLISQTSYKLRAFICNIG